MGQMFMRAILCNFFVCLGVLCGIKLKSETGKFLMIVMCISAFVFSGFEHCIANMGIFVVSLGLVDGLSVGLMLKSMLDRNAWKYGGRCSFTGLAFKKDECR